MLSFLITPFIQTIEEYRLCFRTLPFFKFLIQHVFVLEGRNVVYSEISGDSVLR